MVTYHGTATTALRGISDDNTSTVLLRPSGRRDCVVSSGARSTMKCGRVWERPSGAEALLCDWSAPKIAVSPHSRASSCVQHDDNSFAAGRIFYPEPHILASAMRSFCGLCLPKSRLCCSGFRSRAVPYSCSHQAHLGFNCVQGFHVSSRPTFIYGH
jgi:hypothetical protein